MTEYIPFSNTATTRATPPGLLAPFPNRATSTTWSPTPHSAPPELLPPSPSPLSEGAGFVGLFLLAGVDTTIPSTDREGGQAAAAEACCPRSSAVGHVAPSLVVSGPDLEGDTEGGGAEVIKPVVATVAAAVIFVSADAATAADDDDAVDTCTAATSSSSLFGGKSSRVLTVVTADAAGADVINTPRASAAVAGTASTPAGVLLPPSLLLPRPPTDPDPSSLTPGGTAATVERSLASPFTPTGPTLHDEPDTPDNGRALGGGGVHGGSASRNEVLTGDADADAAAARDALFVSAGRGLLLPGTVPILSAAGEASRFLDGVVDVVVAVFDGVVFIVDGVVFVFDGVVVVLAADTTDGERRPSRPAVVVGAGRGAFVIQP